MNLHQLKDQLAQECGLIPENKAKGLCIACGEPAIPKCYTQSGRNEFGISGLCEPCFDGITKGAK